MAFSDIEANVRSNLNDAGVTFYKAEDLLDSINDAYNDVSFLTGFQIKQTFNLAYTANKSYYRVTELASDCIYPLAIFDQQSKRWLDDDTSLKDLDTLDTCWENRNGRVRKWIFAGIDLIAFYPKVSDVNSLFDLIYVAKPSAVVLTDNPSFATDMAKLVEYYVTADLFEQAEEFTKAAQYWVGSDGFEGYYPIMDRYQQRIKQLAKADVWGRM